MTMQQAQEKLAEDRKVLERALSAMQTAEAFFAVGEDETAVTIGTHAWFMVRHHYRQQWDSRA